jgi:hypothetical protein
MKKRNTYKLSVVFLLLTSLACSQKKSEHPVDGIKVQDKNGYFELYGNYLPTTTISVKDHLLESIQIDTHDSLGGRFIKLVYLQFTNTKTQEGYRVNTSFSGTKDDFSILANDSLLGNIKIKGKFFGVKGPMLDDIKDPKTIVFEGIFSVSGKADIKIECTYFEGD